MTISGLLYLQSELVNDPKVTQVFLECQNRIKSMALIHEKLYQSDNLAEIDIQSYLQRLISFIHSSYLNSINNVTINIDIESGIRLGTEKAISLGLIMNELLSNIFKYAFPSVESGKVAVRFFKKENRYHLFVKDDGVGFPEGYNFSTANSLGLKLVNMMSEQMKGKFAIVNNGGTEFKIEFPA
jgi:two-component sensor histidine kinase